MSPDDGAAFRNSLNDKGKFGYDRFLSMGKTEEEARAEGLRLHEIGEQGWRDAEASRTAAKERILSKLTGWRDYTREQLDRTDYEILYLMEQEYDQEQRNKLNNAGEQ